MKTAWVMTLAAAIVAMSGCAKQNKVTVDSAFTPPATAPAMGMTGASELPPPPPAAMPAYAVPAQPAPAYAAPEAAAPAAGQRTHVVKQGESLWKISGTYYGKPSQAGIAKILKANPAVSNANAIKAGQKLVIPE
jgi:nucleoid-associated protein YgaU